MKTSLALAALLATGLALGCSSSQGDSTPDNPAQQGLDAGAEAGEEAPVEPDAAELQDAHSQQDASEDIAPQPDAAESPVPGADCTSTAERQFACCTFAAVNQFRVDMGLSALAWDPKIAEAAEWYSQYMANAGELAHGLDGRMVGTRLSDFGVDWTTAGENIACNTTEAWEESCVQVFEQWYGSPSHYSLMVNPDYTDGAVGVAWGDGWWYATLNVVAH